MITVRQLSGSDALRYRDVRLEALRNTPSAFGSDAESEERSAESDWAQGLQTQPSFGAFEDETLQGVATLLAETRLKTRHRGQVVAVYVRPEARSKGVGSALIGAVIAQARRMHLVQLHLSVTSGNGAARRLYERAGFQTYGIDPRALLVDGHYHDEHLMVLRLDDGQPESDVK